jgi:hypothetical protein
LSWPPWLREDLEQEAITAGWLEASKLDLTMPVNQCRSLIVDKAAHKVVDAGRVILGQEQLRAVRVGRSTPTPWITQVMSIEGGHTDNENDEPRDLIEATGPSSVDPQKRVEYLELLDGLTDMPPRVATALILDRKEAAALFGVSEGYVDQLRRQARDFLEERGLAA